MQYIPRDIRKRVVAEWTQQCSKCHKNLNIIRARMTKQSSVCCTASRKPTFNEFQNRTNIRKTRCNTTSKTGRIESELHVSCHQVTGPVEPQNHRLHSDCQPSTADYHFPPVQLVQFLAHLKHSKTATNSNRNSAPQTTTAADAKMLCNHHQNHHITVVIIIAISADDGNSTNIPSLTLTEYHLPSTRYKMKQIIHENDGLDSRRQQN